MASALRVSVAVVLAVGAIGFSPLVSGTTNADGDQGLIRDGRAGFVVADFAYVLAPDASETGACPQGLSQHYRAIFDASAEGARRAGESDEEYTRRGERGAAALATNAEGQYTCLNPQSGAPDPFYRTVTGANVPVTGGLDLDGQVSRADGRPAPGTCAHDDFRSIDGRRGIDNQFYRVVGCTTGYQPNGAFNGFATEMLTGSWGILIAIDGVDDMRNDPEVEVGFFANNDPIQLSAAREPIANVTYSMTQDPRFRATARGRIQNGVLTTEPVDVRFVTVTAGMRMERPLKDARVRATLSETGVLEGVLGGYADIEELYDYQFGFRRGREGNGELTAERARGGRATGASNRGGFTCQGVYAALVANADGHRDPATRRCTSISTQYRFRAVPAFLIDAASRSTNADLDE